MRKTSRLPPSFNKSIGIQTGAADLKRKGKVMIKNLRPRQAADALGIGLSTFWLKVKTDPDFPQLIRLSPQCTVVRESDLEEYVNRKAAATAKPARAIAA